MGTADTPKIPDAQIDALFLRKDKERIKRTRNIMRVPDRKHRTGGKRAYGEWCHVIGIFQTLLYQTLENKTGGHILDVGCGTGLMGIAAEPFVRDNGLYTGLDVNKEFIDFCKNHYTPDYYRFIHHNMKNAFYAGHQPETRERWPLESDSFDLVTALSVWTHFKEEDALFYLKEVERVLKPGKKAIVTFFYLNKEYDEYLRTRKDEPSRYNTFNQEKWTFDKKAYDSEHWFHMYDVPEQAIAVDEQGMKMLADHSNLEITAVYNGNWKEIPGLYFQDIVIFLKK